MLLNIVVLLVPDLRETLCAAGASVSVLCTGSLGSSTRDLPAKERGWPGSHT